MARLLGFDIDISTSAKDVILSLEGGGCIHKIENLCYLVHKISNSSKLNFNIRKFDRFISFQVCTRIAPDVTNFARLLHIDEVYVEGVYENFSRITLGNIFSKWISRVTVQFNGNFQSQAIVQKNILKWNLYFFLLS